MPESLKQLVLRDDRHGEESSFAAVKIGEDGSFVFEGVDAGPGVLKFFGDSDYEYWLRVRSEAKDAMLLYLVKDRFSSVHDLEKWLSERDVPAEFTSF